MPDPAYEAKYGKGPHRAADAIVSHRGFYALIKRRKDGIWAIPGGIVDPGETFRQAAFREFHEECGVDLNQPNLLDYVGHPIAFDDPDRDPRSWIITGAVAVKIWKHAERPILIPGDDAEDADWFSANDIPPLYADHNQILEVVSSLYP